MGESVLTEPFARIDGQLCCGEVPAEELAERFGTPLYVYDIRRVDDRVRAVRHRGRHDLGVRDVHPHGGARELAGQTPDLFPERGREQQRLPLPWQRRHHAA